MKPAFVVIVILALVLTGVFVAVASAGSSTSQIIKDASDGTVDGHYSAAQVRAALAAVNSDPAYSQYSDVAGVLQAYLTSLSTSGSSTGTGTKFGTPGASQTATPTGSVKRRAAELDYTGGEPLVAFAVGGALILAGVALRRRWAAP